MVASRYQASFGYAPRMASGAYQGGRNALAPVYSAPPAGSVGGPVGLPQAPAMQAPMAPAAPSLTSGTGALSGQPRPQDLIEGNGGGFNDPGGEYGGPGPQGAPSTGNFGRDAMNFGREAGGFLGLAMGGPLGIAAGTIAGLGIGAINAFAPETARAIFSSVYGAPSFGEAPMGNLGDTPTPAGGNFGPGANVTGGNFADPSMTSTPDVGAPPGVTSMDGMTGNPDGALGNPGDFGTPAGGNFGDGANSDGGAGMNSGGESNTSDGTAGMGSSESGNGWRYGGYTGHGEDGDIDPYEVAGPVHEGEYVLRHEATQHYGPELLHALNSGTIPVNALMGLAMARKPTASNHLLQMMMR